MSRLTVCRAVTLLLVTAALPASAEIRWHAWGAAAFEQARGDNRPLIVNVGHEGCTACRTMEEGAFSDARVVALMNHDFVAIQVDSEMQPDIGDRYSDWAWPATAFLKPDGTQVFAIRGARRADDFVALLERVLERHRAGELRTDDLAPYGAPSTVRDDPLNRLRDEVRMQLDRPFDDARGGWGEAKILETAAPALQLFLRAHLYDDARSRKRALQTAAGFLGHLDPVWGGLFYASFGRWDNVVHEKRLETQAAGLRLFADAYRVSGEQRYADALAAIHRYLTTMMRADDGTFYANQKDTGPRLDDGLSIGDYYALDNAGRRARGLPLVDRAVYTDVNARVISGLAAAFNATGERAYLDSALAAATALLQQRQTGAGWLRQFDGGTGVTNDARVHAVQATGLPYLRAQAHFGLAALDLYQATADPRWRRTALAVTAGMRETLEDPALGGFWGGPANAVDDVVGRRKPLEDNAVAARLLYWLGVLEKDTALRGGAERTIRAVASPAIVTREGRVTGNLALTLELLTAGYVELSVVGDGATADALLAAGRAVYEPRRLLHPEKPGRYPARDTAAMYICNDDQCSVPITEPSRVSAQAAKFRPAMMARQ